MPPSSIEYLHHILEESQYLAEHVKGMERTAFLLDDTAKRAFVRSIEIIGEAAKKVPPEVRDQYSEIQWRAMCGMRDKLVHDYFGVDYGIVWDVAVNKAPVLYAQIAAILVDTDEE